MRAVCKIPLVITPPADLLQQHPQLRQAAHALALSYAHNERVTDERLQAIGSVLWQVLAIDEMFEKADQYAASKILPIIIESSEAAIQNLPWEVLHHPQHGFLGREAGFTLSRRIPMAQSEPTEPEKGPLRVLLFSSLPDDLDGERGRLAVEEEQEHVLEALMMPVMEGRVQLEIPDDGRFSTLEQQLNTFQPQLVFLSGHGKFHQTLHDESEAYGTFLFEDENGLSEAIKEHQLATLFRGSGVQCVVLSACESGKAASDALNNGLARQLAHHHLPHVVGMRESILDRAGILFARHFCEAIGRQEPVNVALQQARRAITQPLKEATWRDGDKSGLTEQSLGQWSLPTLYSRDITTPLIDWDFTPQPPTTEIKNVQLEGLSLPQKFRGRRRELRQFNSRLAKGERQQLLLTGPGGQGKTALVGKLALSLQSRGWQVVAWSAKEEESWSSFLLGLQLKLNEHNSKQYHRVPNQIQQPVEQLCYLLEMLLTQSQSRLVVVLDNLESLQDEQSRALGEQAVENFIAAAQSLGAKGLRLLLTSRWRLPQWPEENHWPLTRFSYGDFLQLCILNHDQLKTLAHRKERLRAVYQALNGNARGLNFFAAAVQGMDLPQEEAFLAKLAEAGAEVQVDMALARVLTQRTEPQLALLQRLQCYPAPVPIEGIIKLAPDQPQAKALLAELVAFSLVEKSEHPHWLAQEYHCATLVSQAVNAQLKTALAPRYAALAADYQAWLFHNERRDLTQAHQVHTAHQRAGQTGQADRFALDYIVSSLSRAGLYATLLKEWLPPICEAKDPQIRAKALNQMGIQCLHIGDYEKALSHLKQALAMTQEIGDKSGEGRTLNNISQVFQARGDYETALSYLKQSLAIKEEIGDKAGEGTALNNIAQIFQARGDYEAALSYLKQALVIKEEIGDKSGEGTALNNIAQIFQARGDYKTALSYLKQALVIRQEIGDKSGEGRTLNNMATIAHARGDYETALSYFKQSLVIQQEIGDKAGEGITLNNISLIFQARGDYKTALSYLKQALAITREIGYRLGEGTALNNISQIFQARGDYETALRYLKQALVIRQEIDDKAGEGTTLNNISQIFKARGDYEAALSYLKPALAIAQEIGDKSGEGTTLNNISQIFKARGDYERALSHLKQALAIQQEIGDTADLCTTLFNIGHIHWQNEEQSEARQAWLTVYRLAKPMQLAQVLEALEGLAEKLGLEGGLDGWAALAQQMEEETP